MKTIAKITLLVALIITAHAVQASGYKIQRKLLPSGNYLEIITLEEKAVEETIPGYESFIKEANANNSICVSEIHFYEEPDTSDYDHLHAANQGRDAESHEKMHQLLAAIHQPEKNSHDYPFCTMEIFNEYHNEKQLEAREYILTNIIEEEEEEFSDIPLLIFAGN